MHVHWYICMCCAWMCTVCLQMIKKLTTGFTTTFCPPVDSPQINKHPGDQPNVVCGSTVWFTVTATGGEDLKYKWKRNGVDLNPPPAGVSGESTNTLKIQNVKKNHEGTYTCIVSNTAGGVTSNPAQLTVRECLTFMSNSANLCIARNLAILLPFRPMHVCLCVCVCVCVCVYEQVSIDSH